MCRLNQKQLKIQNFRANFKAGIRLQFLAAFLNPTSKGGSFFGRHFGLGGRGKNCPFWRNRPPKACSSASLGEGGRGRFVIGVGPTQAQGLRATSFTGPALVDQSIVFFFNAMLIDVATEQCGCASFVRNIRSFSGNVFKPQKR